MAKSKKSPARYREVFHEEEDAPELSAESKRLNRVIGQIEGIKKMLDEGREIAAILMQCKAAHAALKSVEARLLAVHMEEALDDIMRTDKRKQRDDKIEQLIELYKAV